MAKRKKEKQRKYTAPEILSLVTGKREAKEVRDWLDQIEGDFDNLSLKVYEPEKKGHQAYTSPRPRNDYLKVFHGVNKATLTWKVAFPEDASKSVRDAASKCELLITGVLDQADRELRENGEPSLRESVAALGCSRGAAGLVCHIYPGEEREDGEKETVIDIRPLDPMHVTYERGQKGLAWAAFHYRVGGTEARDRFGIELRDASDPKATAVVVDFFDRHINAVVFAEGGQQDARLASAQFVKEPTPHELGRVPIFIGFSSGLPTFFDRNFEPNLKVKAASVFASSRQVYSMRNKQISFAMDVAEKSVAGTFEFIGEGDQLNMRADPWKAWNIVSHPVGTVLKLLDPPKVPEAAITLLAVLDRELQESTVPFPIGYGLDPQAHSGTALQMMNDNMRSIYGPFTRLLEDAYRWLCQEILTQFKAKGQKITLRGFNSEGKFFEHEADPADVVDNVYIQVQCEPQLPRDEAGQLQMAMLASQPGRDGEPLVSRFTAREQYLMLQDPDAEAKRIDDEKVLRVISQHPLILIRKMALALFEQGDKEEALELLASIPSPMAGQVPQGGPSGPMPGGVPPEAMTQGVPGMAQGVPGGMPMAGPSMEGPMVGRPSPQGGVGPSPEQVIAVLQAIAARLVATGRPVPPQIQAILRMVQGGP